jgi:flagellar biosynthetic protein FliR
MVTLHLNLADFGVFFAILLRLSIVVFMLPVFNSSQVPNSLKVCAAVSLTAMLYPSLRPILSPLSFEPTALLVCVMGELIFGVMFSLSILLVFAAYQMAGELIAFEMGFGFAQAADPQSGAHTTLISVWFQVLATLAFLSLDGHHILLKAVMESFKTIPVGGFTLTPEIYERFIGFSTRLFVIAIKMAAPITVVLLLTQVGLGLMAKFSPQFNILMNSFPLTIFLGLVFMGFSMIVWGNLMHSYFKNLFQFLISLLA